MLPSQEDWFQSGTDILPMSTKDLLTSYAAGRIIASKDQIKELMTTIFFKKQSQLSVFWLIQRWSEVLSCLGANTCMQNQEQHM